MKEEVENEEGEQIIVTIVLSSEKLRTFKRLKAMKEGKREVCACGREGEEGDWRREKLEEGVKCPD